MSAGYSFAQSWDAMDGVGNLMDRTERLHNTQGSVYKLRKVNKSRNSIRL